MKKGSKKRKRLYFILIAAGLTIVTVVLIWFFFLRQDILNNKYHENAETDVITYGGKKYTYNDHWSHYLFLGIDTREEITEYEVPGGSGQADAIYLVSYDRVEKIARCIAIPRDSMTNIHVFAPDGTDLGYSVNHLTLQYAFGDGKAESCRLMSEAVSSMLYGLPVAGYCSINMDGITAAMDVLGEVEVTVPDDTLEGVNPLFKKGETVTITKDNAEQFVRYRDITVSHSAISRMNRQKVFLKACGDKASKMYKEDKQVVTGMLDAMQSYMVTNMSADTFATLLKADTGSDKKIIDIPGEKVDGKEFDEYNIDEDGLYELILQLFYVEA